MSSERTLDGLLKEIDGLVKLSPANLSVANKHGEMICKTIEEFKDAIEPDIAQRDLIRLKDGALALQEFLVANASSLELSSRTNVGPNIDLEELIKALHEDNAISERTFVMLTTYLARNGRSKLRAPIINEQISQISTHLSELHKMRRVSSDA